MAKVDYFPTAYRLEWMQDSERDVQESAYFLEKLIALTQPDIIHLNQFCYGSLHVSVPRLVVAHSDVNSWWNSVHGTNPPSSEWLAWYDRTVNQGLAQADLVVAPSHWMMAALARHYTVPERRKVIYNGRSPSHFEQLPKKANCALTVGRIWDSGKQTSLLFGCASTMHLRIVGPERSPASGINSTPRETRDTIEFCGECGPDRLRQLYAEAAIYIATSRYEPFGLAPVEAALSHCALVANDMPVFRELWEDAALFFRRNDARDLEFLLQTLNDEPEMREQYATRAYQRASERFGAARMVAEYELAYEQLVAQRVCA
jgi:glycogen synthase